MKVLLPSKWSEELFNYWYKKAFCVLLKNRYDAKFYVADTNHLLLLDRELELSLQINRADEGEPSKITLVKLVVTVRVSADNAFVSTSEFYLLDSSDTLPFYRLIAGTDTGFSNEVLRIIQACIFDSMSYVMKAMDDDPGCHLLITDEWKNVSVKSSEAVELYHLYTASDDEAKHFSEFLGRLFIQQKPMARCSILSKLGVVNFSVMSSDTSPQCKTVKYPLAEDWSEQMFFTLANISGTMFMCSLQNSNDPFVLADILINITGNDISCYVRYKQDADRIDIADEISQFGKVFHRWFTETFEKFVFHMIIKRGLSAAQ